MAQIVLENVSKVYGKNPGVLAVDRMSLTVRDQEFLVLLGPSGCGKTSTLRMIAGLEPVSGGAIYFDGRCVNDLAPRQRDIAMAFENYALYPTLTVWENIAFPLRTRSARPEQIRGKVQWAAEALQIHDILDKRPGELSGGQQQRVSLARAIVRAPQAFLLDEPLSHLDTRQRRIMRAQIKRLNADLKTTMICVTHDQKEAMAMADRVAVMHNGALLQVGSPLEIFNDPVNEFVAGFIGEPAMNFADVEVQRDRQGLVLRTKEGTGVARLSPGDMEGQAPALPATLRMGIRPRHVRFTAVPASEDHLRAQVRTYESVGERGILTVDLEAQRWRILTKPDQSYRKGDLLWIQFPREHIYLFSRETGQRLRR